MTSLVVPQDWEQDRQGWEIHPCFKDTFLPCAQHPGKQPGPAAQGRLCSTLNEGVVSKKLGSSALWVIL